MLNLCEARQKYKPSVPEILRTLSQIHLTGEGTSPATPEIKTMFSKTAGRPVVKAKKGEERSSKPLRVGVVFSGGQASGGHNVIAGLFDALKSLNEKSSLVGFLNGPKGIMEGKSKDLAKELIDRFRNQGGFDLIGSGRDKIATEEQLLASLKSMKGLDGLVIIGGDDSNTTAAILAEYFLKNGCSTRVVGVPKTIDGDLKNEYVSISFGFDTACKTYSELIGNIARDALSAKKYYHFIKLMGRSASHVTLECALATHPNLTLIGEEKKSLEQVTDEICNLINKRQEKGKDYGIILIPEGLIEFMPKMPERVQKQIQLDPHGNIGVSQIETDLLLIEAVKEKLKVNAVPHFFGYEGRAGLPTNFDANYCYVLGHGAALLIDQGFTGYMAFVSSLEKAPSQWSIGGLPITMLMHFEMRKGKSKPVIQKALVDLKGKPYLAFKKESPRWALEDDYRFPGPIQFYGDAVLTDTIPLILQ